MKKSDLLARELNKALAEEARIEEKYGTDHEDGTVIAFRVQFVEIKTLREGRKTKR